MTKFISDHCSAIAVVLAGTGSVLLAGGVLLRIELARRRDVELWLHELNCFRDEICQLRHEIELLRTKMCQLVNGSTSGNGNTSSSFIRGGSEMMSRVSSTVSLESMGNYVDALDKLIASDKKSSSGTEFLESQKNKNKSDPEVEGIAMLDDLLEKDEFQQVYDYIHQMPVYSCNDPSVLWRYAKACYGLSKMEDKKSSRKEKLILEGKKFASKAYEINSNDFNALKWLTLLTGAATDYLDIRKKIEEGQLFKQLLDKALALKPKDYVLLHLRGRYSYAVTNLSWIEKGIASKIFRTPLVATVDDALNDFLEVERLKPGSWIDNLLFTAKCYLAKNDQLQAIKYLKDASKLKPSDEIEKENLKEVLSLLEKLNQ